MLHISLFSGLGGFEVAAQWMGWKNIVSCEINEFANTVREFYWPESYHHKDIHTLSYETIDTELSKRFGTRWRNDDIVLTGGFPCQPFSAAGKRKGTDDSRYLWPEMLRVIREVRPKWIVGENVYGLVNWDGGVVLDKVCSDLEDEGFKVLPVVLPAAGVNAPHRRDRIFFIAKNTISHGCILGEPVQEGAGVREQRDAGTGDTERVRGEEMAGVDADTQLPRLQGSGESGEVREEETRLGGEGDQPSVDYSAGDRQWDVSDADISGLEGSREAGDIGGEGKESNEQSSGLYPNHGDSWNAADSDRNERLNLSGHGTHIRREAEEDTGTPNHGVDGDVADPDQIGLQFEGGSTRMERFGFGFDDTQNHKPNWEDFPTQSPICGRDDELSSRLHGITFSKWRQESIKGYGNAVVPALVYQLFATIQRMEDDPQLKLF